MPEDDTARSHHFQCVLRVGIHVLKTMTRVDETEVDLRSEPRRVEMKRIGVELFDSVRLWSSTECAAWLDTADLSDRSIVSLGATGGMIEWEIERVDSGVRARVSSQMPGREPIKCSKFEEPDCTRPTRNSAEDRQFVLAHIPKSTGEWSNDDVHRINPRPNFPGLFVLQLATQAEPNAAQESFDSIVEWIQDSTTSGAFCDFTQGVGKPKPNTSGIRRRRT